ncbi:hypothetical protein BH23GEM9_BH23GEM9_25780 [soil metagenome]
MLSRLRRLSLRHQMAIAFSVLTALVLIFSVLLAEREVRRSSRVAAEERLSRVVDQLAVLVSNSAEQRFRLKQNAARQPVVAAMLRGSAVERDSLLRAIETLRLPADSGLPIQIWDRNGSVVFNDMPDAGDIERRYQPLIPLDTAPAYGAFHQRDAEVHYYSTVPVVSAGRTLGWIVQRRRIGNPTAAAELQRLIGNNSRVLFSYPGDSLWITMAGEMVAAPLTDSPSDTTAMFADAAGRRFLVRGREVTGAPWSVFVEVPMSVVEASSRTFLRRMALSGAALVLIFTTVGWLLSRRLTVPLSELAEASDAMRAGEYERRVQTQHGGDELSRLANAFNSMAEQVAASHQALERRLAEASSLASSLEAANATAEQARATAEAADRAKSEFLATMSHEIRTPINAVLGFCQLLEMDTSDEAARRDYLRRTQRAARQLAALVDDILDLAKAEAGSIRIDAVTAPVRPIVEHISAMLEDEIRRKSIVIDVELDDSARFHADPQRVEQVMLNLISNAVKFTPSGGRIAVRGQLAAANASTAGLSDGRPVLHLAVVDSGIGIEEAELERIFEPFVQAQSGYTREYGGTGLGLTISRRLARLMGGDITVQSEPGSGSTFTLVLPAARGTPAYEGQDVSGAAR